MVEYLKARGSSVLLLPERLENIGAFPETNVGKIDKKAFGQDIENKLINEGVTKK